MSFALQEARLQRGSSRREGLVASALPMACLADAPSAPPVILVLSAACLADAPSAPPVILVLSMACLADVLLLRRRDLAANPRYVGTLPLSDATSVLAWRLARVREPEKALDDSGGR